MPVRIWVFKIRFVPTTNSLDVVAPVDILRTSPKMFGLAVSAKGASVGAAIDAPISAAIAGVMTELRTGDVEAALKEAGVAASEGVMWGAIGGSIFSGAASLGRLAGAARGGLKLGDAARAQLLGFPHKTIKMMRNGKEVGIYERAGFQGRCVFQNNRHLLRRINLRHKDDAGLTNLQRMRSGKAPLDPKTDRPYELHHIGQKADSPLAILTREEHRG